MALLSGLYASVDLQSWATGIRDAPKLVLACFVFSWPLLGAFSALGATHEVAGALVASSMMAVAAGLTRAGARAQLHRVTGLRQRTLVVGSGEVASQLVRRLDQHPELGLAAIGYLDDAGHDDALMLIPHLGPIDSLGSVLELARVDRVMIAFSRASHHQLLNCIRVCRDADVAVDIVPRLFEFLEGAQTVNQLGGMPLMSIDPPAFSRFSAAIKRAFDIVGAGLGLLALAPLLSAIAIAIKIDSRGPILFAQERSGWRGRPFRLYKFRSMHHGSSVLVREDGAIVKSRNDSRVTRVGRLIRRFSLDEAPQLINVLKGDMSLVGPRPLVMAEYHALNADWHARRADLRPGLTGPWQVAGRSNISFQEMVQFDYQYVAGWSLARDLELVFATVPAVLSGRGAY
jgi:exopolysaccharide biosynthesis polyprenyl glycosylphosphotransferase